MDDQKALGRRTRLAPAARQREIVRAAVGFFAEKGFVGQTRELARSIGVSQALLFRYFPTKEDLIERVYQEVFDKDWRPNLASLSEADLSLEERLTAFYVDYAQLMLERDYTRLLLFAALGGVDYHDRLFKRIGREIYPAVIDAVRAERGRPSTAMKAPTPDEIEAVWGLHAQLFFWGVREHVFDLPVSLSKDMVARKVRSFLSGLNEMGG